MVHLGSSPAQLGFIMRPLTGPPRHTFQNIQETGYYTINHISESIAEKAHYTSAKLDREESEFDCMKIAKEFIDDFQAPFVKDSTVKIGMKHIENILLPNGCYLVIGSVELVVFPDKAISNLGHLDLSEYNGVGISGLNTYYSLSKLKTFPYVRLDEIPDFE